MICIEVLSSHTDRASFFACIASISNLILQRHKNSDLFSDVAALFMYYNRESTTQITLGSLPRSPPKLIQLEPNAISWWTYLFYYKLFLI
jgi:hypothetical protein